MATPAAHTPGPDQDYTAPHTLVGIGRRRLNLVVLGDGSPTVIFAPGLINTSLEWARVQSAVALTTRTVAFDKAGMGFSDPGPLPRTASAVVRDLRAALKAAGLAPPYVLVGWSAGGLQMRLFAFRHPDEVAGMVMVDSSSEYQHRRLAQVPGAAATDRAAELKGYSRLARLARAGALTPGTPDHVRAVGLPSSALTPAMNAARAALRTSPHYWRAARSEAAAMWGADGGSASGDQLFAARRLLGDLPLIILTAGGNALPRPEETDAMAQARHHIWRTLHDEIAALSTCGERRTVEGAGHAILLDRPDAVISAIDEVLAQVRGR